MTRNFDLPVDLACPHDGWYNGNPKLMIANGTYADYRPRLVEWVRKGKMSEIDLNAFDAQWAKLEIETKKKRRAKVLEDIKKVPVRQKDGKVEYVSKPSDNGAGANADKVPALTRKLTHRQPLGSLDTRPDPLAVEEAALLAQKSEEANLPPSDGGKGHAVPDFVPPSMVQTPMPPVAPKTPSMANAL